MMTAWVSEAWSWWWGMCWTVVEMDQHKHSWWVSLLFSGFTLPFSLLSLSELLLELQYLQRVARMDKVSPLSIKHGVSFILLLWTYREKAYFIFLWSSQNLFKVWHRTNNTGFFSFAEREWSSSKQMNAHSSLVKVLERKIAFGLISFNFWHVGPNRVYHISNSSSWTSLKYVGERGKGRWQFIDVQWAQKPLQCLAVLE